MLDCAQSARLSPEDPLAKGRDDAHLRAQSARLSPDQRLGEIAAIFAVGLVRLDQRAALPAKQPLENPPKKPPEGLEFSDPARLSVRVG